MVKAIDLVTSNLWAIKPDYLQKIAGIALRENEDWSVQAARLGKPLESTYKARTHGSVAVIPISGPIFPKANLMTEFSGATSLRLASHDLTTAVENSEIKAIVLEIDSPGGVAFGPAEFAEQVRAASKVKPVIAYVAGMACSAAYWIASSAGEIVAHSSSILGSIGVVTSLPYQEKPDQNGDLWIEIVSSNAKNKRPDARTDEGRAEVLRELDAIEERFHAGVGEYRGVSRETIINEFGNGGVLIAGEAVRVGMADRLGSLEALLQELNDAPSTSLNQPGGKKMTTNPDKKTEQPAAPATSEQPTQTFTAQDIERARAEGTSAGAQAERERIAGLDAVNATGFETLLAEAKADGKTTAGELALKINAAQKAAGQNHLQTLQNEAGKQPAIDPSVDTSGAPKVDENSPLEERAKSEWNASAEIRKEFGSFDAFHSYKKGVESGQIKEKVKKQ